MLHVIMMQLMYQKNKHQLIMLIEILVDSVSRLITSATSSINSAPSVECPDAPNTTLSGLNNGPIGGASFLIVSQNAFPI